MERPARSSWPDHASGRGCTGPPELTDLVDADLKIAVDFRRVYATVLEDWLGLRSKQALGGCLRVAAAISLTAARIVPSFKSSLPQSGTTVGPPFVGLRHFLCEPLPVRGTSRHPRLDSFLVTSRYLMARR